VHGERGLGELIPLREEHLVYVWVERERRLARIDRLAGAVEGDLATVVI
jgi:hypothetical protein